MRFVTVRGPEWKGHPKITPNPQWDNHHNTVHHVMEDKRGVVMGYALVRKNIFFSMDVQKESGFLQHFHTETPSLFWKNMFEQYPCFYGWTSQRFPNKGMEVLYGPSNGVNIPFIFAKYEDQEDIKSKAALDEVFRNNKRVVVLYTKPGEDDEIARDHMHRYAAHVTTVKYVTVDVSKIPEIKYQANLPIVCFYIKGVKVQKVEAYQENDWEAHQRFLYKPPYHEVFCDADIDRVMDEHLYTGILFIDVDDPDMEYMRIQFERICRKRYIAEKTTVIAYRDKWPDKDKKYMPYTKRNTPPVCVGFLGGVPIKVESGMNSIKETLDDHLGTVSKKDRIKVCKPRFLDP